MHISEVMMLLQEAWMDTGRWVCTAYVRSSRNTLH